MEEDFDPTELGRSSLQDKSAKRDWAQNRSDKLILPQPTWVSGRDSDRSNNIIVSSGLGQQFGSSITNGAIGLGDRVSASGGLVNATPHVKKRSPQIRIVEPLVFSKIKFYQVFDAGTPNVKAWIEGFQKKPVKINLPINPDLPVPIEISMIMENLGGSKFSLHSFLIISNNNINLFRFIRIDFVSISSVPSRNWNTSIDIVDTIAPIFTNYMGYGYTTVAYPLRETLSSTLMSYKNCAVIDGNIDFGYPNTNYINEIIGDVVSLTLPGSYLIYSPGIYLEHARNESTSVAKTNIERTRLYAHRFGPISSVMFLSSAPTQEILVPYFGTSQLPFRDFFRVYERQLTLVGDSIYRVINVDLDENVASVRQYQISDAGETTIRNFDEPFFPLQEGGQNFGVSYHPN